MNEAVFTALRDLLDSGVEGAYRCVYVNVEVGQVGREDLGRTMRAVLIELAREARSTLGDESLAEIRPDVLRTVGPDVAPGEEQGAILDEEIDALPAEAHQLAREEVRS